MPNNHHDSPLVTISIDVRASQEQNRLQRLENETLGRLLLALQQNNLTATWAIASPDISVASKSICDVDAAHEIAILADSTWAGPNVGRTHFARELLRRVDEARDGGRAISTLAMYRGRIDEHLDLLVKHRINLIREVSLPTKNRPRKMRAKSLRYGLWQATPVLQIPSTQRWWQQRTRGLLRRIVREAAEEKAPVHITFDIAKISSGGPAAWRNVLQSLQQIAQLHARGNIAVGTLREVCRIYSRVRITRPARSILRPAA